MILLLFSNLPSASHSFICPLFKNVSQQLLPYPFLIQGSNSPWERQKWCIKQSTALVQMSDLPASPCLSRKSSGVAGWCCQCLGKCWALQLASLPQCLDTLELSSPGRFGLCAETKQIKCCAEYSPQKYQDEHLPQELSLWTASACSHHHMLQLPSFPSLFDFRFH